MTDQPTNPWLIEIIHQGGSSLAGRTQTFSGPLVRIGRRPDNHVAFDPEIDRKVSGYHAEVEIDAAGGITIREVSAQNGVLVNGVRITGPVKVGPVDVVRLGQSGPELRLRATNAAAEEKQGIGEQTLARAVSQAAASERGKNRRSLLLATAILGVFGVLLAWWLLARSDDLQRRQEAFSSGQQALDRRLGEVGTQVARSGAADWAGLVERYQESIFLCVGQAPGGQGGIGTAFAVDGKGGVLATNAHVAKMLLEMPDIVAVQNRTGKLFKIRRTVAHPGFSTPNSPDVGLIQLETPPSGLLALPLADDATVGRLQVGMALGTLGYPGELAANYFANPDTVSERLRGALATFKDGRISRLTDYQSRSCTAEQVRIVQHSASLSGGTSGSPMFTADGTVVAINNAGLDAMVMVANPEGGKLEAARMPSGAQIGFAIRIDELRRFIVATAW